MVEDPADAAAQVAREATRADVQWEDLRLRIGRAVHDAAARAPRSPDLELTRLRDRVEVLEKRLAEITGPSHDILIPDPVSDWIAAHPDELARFRGKHVAIDPNRGIVASGETLEEVAAEVDRLGLAGVTYDVVPVFFQP